jgi:hypothetical protein
MTGRLNAEQSSGPPKLWEFVVSTSHTLLILKVEVYITSRRCPSSPATALGGQDKSCSGSKSPSRHGSVSIRRISNLAECEQAVCPTVSPKAGENWRNARRIWMIFAIWEFYKKSSNFWHIVQLGQVEPLLHMETYMCLCSRTTKYFFQRRTFLKKKKKKKSCKEKWNKYIMFNTFILRLSRYRVH